MAKIIVSGLNNYEHSMYLWDFHQYKKTLTIEANRTEDILCVEGPGLWVICNLTATLPNVKMRADIDGNVIGDTIKDVFDIGLTEPSASYFFCSLYDTTNNKYNLAFQPSYPVGFRDSLTKQIINNESSSVTAIFSCVYATVRKREK